MVGHLSFQGVSSVCLIRSRCGIPFSWWYDLHNTTPHPPSLDAVHVALEILELLHSWLEDRYASLGKWIIFGTEVVSSVGVWGTVGVVEAVEMVGLHNCGGRRCRPRGC